MVIPQNFACASVMMSLLVRLLMSSWLQTQNTMLDVSKKHTVYP